MRLSQNRPLFDVAQMCVKPRKANVSGFPRPVGCANWYVAVTCRFVPKLGSVL